MKKNKIHFKFLSINRFIRFEIQNLLILFKQFRTFFFLCFFIILISLFYNNSKASSTSDITEWKNETASTEIIALIPDGIYTNRKCSFEDLDLIPSNIFQGINIFGVTGTFLPLGAAPLCLDNNLSSSACTTSTNRYVSSILGTNLSGTNGNLSIAIPLGYYDGSNSCTMSETNLIAANIKNGITLFGVSGSLNPLYPSCTDNAQSVLSCTTAASRYVSDNQCTSSLQTATGCFATSNSWVNSTQYGGRESNCSDDNGGTCWVSNANKNLLDTDLIPANIKSEVNIFGTLVPNTSTSNAHRTVASSVITQEQEVTNYIGADLPANYHEVPDLSSDDDGYSPGFRDSCS